MNSPVHPFDRLCAYIIAERWSDAEDMLSELGAPTSWRDFLQANRLEAEGATEDALCVFGKLRSELDATKEKNEGERIFRDIVESSELAVQLRHGLCPPEQRNSLQEKFDEISRRLIAHDHSVALARLRESEAWESAPPLMRRLMEETPLAGVVMSTFSVVEAVPQLLRQPARLRNLGLGFSVRAAQVDSRIADPVRAIVKSRADFNKLRCELNVEQMRVLFSDPCVRSLQVRMFEAWRKGCTAQRFWDLGSVHVRGLRALETFLGWGRHAFDGENSGSDEERIHSLCAQYLHWAETGYKEALRAMVRIEWGQDDLTKVPNTIGGLIGQLRSHPKWRVDRNLLSLVRTEFATIRNAIAHHSVSMVGLREVEFVNVGRSGVETRVGPLTVDRLEERLGEMITSYTAIAGAFNYIQPPSCYCRSPLSLTIVR